VPTHLWCADFQLPGLLSQSRPAGRLPGGCRQKLVLLGVDTVCAGVLAYPVLKLRIPAIRLRHLCFQVTGHNLRWIPAAFWLMISRLMHMFTLLGVFPLYQDRTCISGRTCAFDGIYGIGLDSGVQILILDTCGSSSWLPRQPKVAGSGAAMVSWGQVALAAAAGDHRLCWWDAPRFTCSIAENFRVDFGTWTSMGVSPFVTA